MIATLNTIGLRCPADGERLVYADVHEYRCTGPCGGLYIFRLDPLAGIVLTLKDERFLNHAMEGVTITSLAMPTFTTPRLSLIEEQR